MKEKHLMLNALLRAAAAVVVMGIATTVAMATEPCGDLGECKALIEMNTTDGDIGFHFLMDGDDLVSGKVKDSTGLGNIFLMEARSELRQQFFTETFVESAEPLCFDPLTDDDPENDDEDFVTLEEFLELWDEGTYTFIGRDGEGERSTGTTELTFDLPAAPTNLMFDDATSVISWAAGDDLGECATNAELTALVAGGVLPAHPENVAVAAWEVVFEPDVEVDEDVATVEELEAADALGKLEFSIRVPGDIATKEVTVPAEYLTSLPDDTPAKIEVGAIGVGDNATFTEIFDICVNETMVGC